MRRGGARWLSRDPIAENGGINLYGYVGNNPISHIDPLGLITVGVGFQASGGYLPGGGGGQTGFYAGFSFSDGFTFGILGSGQFGGFLGAGGSVGGFIQVTSASCVCQLKGKGMNMGGSGGEGLVLGGEFVGGVPSDPNGNLTYGGGQFNFGGGGGAPGEAHGFVSNTGGWTW